MNNSPRINPHDRQTIERAWAWHAWAPRWLPGRIVVRLKRRALAKYAKLGSCDVDHGRQMVVRLDDMIQCQIAFAGEWEGMILDAVKPFVAPNGTVLDVGGHIGYATLYFADWVGAHGRVFVFEPLASNADAIESNLALNGYKDRTTVVRAAVSDQAGDAFFTQPDPLNFGMGALSTQTSAHNAKEHATPTVALDDWLDARSVTSVQLVKLDIEGAEILALRGMQRGLAAGRYAAILMEVHPAQLPAFGSSIAEVLGLLTSAGYRVQYWDDAGRFVDGTPPPECLYVLATKS